MANAYKSFSHHSLWQLYAINWILGAYLELLKLGEGRILYDRTKNKADLAVYERFSLKMLGGNFDEYERLHQQVNHIVTSLDLQNQEKRDQALREIRHLYEETQWIPQSIKT